MATDKIDPRGPSREWHDVGPEVMAACGQALRRIRATRSDVRSIGVTSTTRGEGRSTIAAGLAASGVRSLGRRCVLMDLDVDSWSQPGPRAAEPVSAQPGKEVLPEGMSWEELGLAAPDRVSAPMVETVQWANPDLGLLRPGMTMSPGELSRGLIEDVRDDLSRQGLDLVVDLSALPPIGSGDEYAHLFDVIVLVVRAGGSSHKHIRQASLALAEPPVVLLNRSKSSVPSWIPFGRGR